MNMLQLWNDTFQKELHALSKKPNLYRGTIYGALYQPLSIKQAGSLFERVICSFFQQLGMDVESGKSGGPFDFVINGRSYELKAGLAQDSPTYTVNQIRDQEYDYLLICMIYMNESFPDVKLWCIPKKIAYSMGNGQHSGKNGNIKGFALRWKNTAKVYWYTPYVHTLDTFVEFAKNDKTITL